MRLQGIDAPERKQPFGNRAREALSELTYMKEAELRCNKIDRYKRHVCSAFGLHQLLHPMGRALLMPV